MKKELINEILRIQVLSNYDTKNTFTENQGVILERTTAKTLAQDARYLEALRMELDDILRTTGALGAKGMFKTADDVIFALKNQSMSVADLGKLNRSILKNSKNPTLRKTAAGWVVSTETFSKAFSSGTATQRLAKLKELNPNMSDDMLKDLHAANELRLKNLGKSGKGPKPKTGGGKTGTGKTGGDIGGEIGGGTKIGGGTGGTKIGGGTGGAKQGDTIINQTFHIDGKTFKNQDEYVKYLNQYGDDFARQNGRYFDDFAKQNGHDNWISWMRKDPDEATRAWIKEGRSGKGVFAKFVNWGKRTITWKGLWGLAKLAAIGYGIWWLYDAFKKEDIDTICDEQGMCWAGQGKGCLPCKKEDDDDDDDDNDKDTGGGGGGIVDNQGNKYIECDPPFYKGCVGKKGNTDIQKAQECLGVTPNGFFNQETEDALYKKINKKNFSSSDMSNICARSLGSSGFEI